MDLPAFWAHSNIVDTLAVVMFLQIPTVAELSNPSSLLFVFTPVSMAVAVEPESGTCLFVEYI